MAAKDLFHESVKRALEKQEWCITDDPLPLNYGGVKIQIDLAAERVLLAERGTEKIAVEVKSFLNPSTITDFYGALGQFLSYRLVLEKVEPDRRLYLAVPVETYESFFQLGFTKSAIQQYGLTLLVYHPIAEEIAQWID